MSFALTRFALGDPYSTEGRFHIHRECGNFPFLVAFQPSRYGIYKCKRVLLVLNVIKHYCLYHIAISYAGREG